MSNAYTRLDNVYVSTVLLVIISAGKLEISMHFVPFGYRK